MDESILMRESEAAGARKRDHRFTVSRSLARNVAISTVDE